MCAHTHTHLRVDIQRNHLMARTLSAQSIQLTKWPKYTSLGAMPQAKLARKTQVRLMQVNCLDLADKTKPFCP